MNYYEELWVEVNELFQQKQYKSVIEKLEEELKMPYVPSAYEEKYRSLLKEARNIANPSGKTNSVLTDEEELENLLFSTNLEEEVMAITSLNQLHIDKYSELVKRYLVHPIYDEIQSMLIYILINQQNSSEWTITKDGCEVTFIPKYCELPQESDGYLEAVTFLQEHLAKEPSLLNLCLELLSVQVLRQLPYSYEETEGEILALSILKQALIASDDEKKWEEICKKHGWDSKKVVIF